MILTEAEVLGLKIMALYNMDMLDGLDCNTCKDKHRQESMNCDVDDSKTLPIFSSSEFGFRLTACPMRCIPDTIIQFIDEYYHYENGNDMGKYNDINHRWFTASKLYRSYINKLTMIKSKTKTRPDDNGRSLMKTRKKHIT